MSKKPKYRAYLLRDDYYELPVERIPGEKKIIVGKVNIDYKCFQKTAREKEVLKVAKAQARLER